MEMADSIRVMVEAARNLNYGLAVVCAVCLVLFLAIAWYDLNVTGGIDDEN